MGQRLENARSLYLEAIRDGNAAEAIGKYSGARYTQHSTPVKDGREGFVEFFEDFHRRNPVREVEIVRGFEDGPFVFLHVVQNLNDGEFRYVTADIFETDHDAKMIEHWDIIAELTPATASGHSQVDGPTEPLDLDQTEENKALVTSFLTTVLRNQEYDKLADYISQTGFTQHDPEIGDGIEGFVAFLDSLAAEGSAMVYEKTYRVIGCGSLVAALSKVLLRGREMAVIDLFRVERGLLVEHWDVMEEILPKESWVNSGKF